MAGKMMYITAVIVLDLIAGAAVFSSIKADTSEADFQSAMTQGADLESKQLYGRAVNAYRAADKIHDSAELRKHRRHSRTALQSCLERLHITEIQAGSL